MPRTVQLAEVPIQWGRRQKHRGRESAFYIRPSRCGRFEITTELVRPPLVPKADWPPFLLRYAGCDAGQHHTEAQAKRAAGRLLAKMRGPCPG